ncbi:hypothetical protein LJB71_01620 [Thermomonas sp. S9]|nr:hypothetical protein [Thermomonas sp. S9]
MALLPAGAYRRFSLYALLAASRSSSTPIAETEVATTDSGVGALAAVGAACGPAVAASSFLQPANATTTAIVNATGTSPWCRLLLADMFLIPLWRCTRFHDSTRQRRRLVKPKVRPRSLSDAEAGENVTE